MSWIGKILGGNPIGAVVGQVIDGIAGSSEEKARARVEIERLVAQRDADIEATLRTELEAKERVLTAELTQGDLYTKRARPTVVYGGLVMIAYNYCLAPALSVPRVELPMEFWAGWSGIVATWSIGRSMEKSGTSNKVTRAVTGSKLLEG